MIRFLLTTMLIGFLGITIYGQNYHQRLSIPSSQNVRDVKFDRQGNTYVVGHGDVEAYCLAETNVENRGTGYLYKVDSAGNILWRLNFGGNMCFAEGLNIGPEGHLYVVGYFRGTGDFSSTSSPSNGLASGNRDNAFILKATAQGEIIWAQSVGGQFDDTARDVTIDDEGNIYVTGSYNRTVNFGGHMLTSAEFSEDPFVWSLTSEGASRWAVGIPSRIAGLGENIEVDSDGNIVTVGRVLHPEMSQPTIYINKMSSSGETIVHKDWQVTNNCKNTGLAIGINNNIYLTGDFSGSIDFDPGIDTFLIIGPTSAISSNAYISVFDKNIDLQTVINTGSAGSFSTGGDLKIADDGRIFAVGAFSRTIDLNPGSGEELVTAGSQGVNTYIQVFDSLGSYQSGLINFIQSFVSYVPVAIDFDDANEKIVLAHEVLGGTQASIRIYGDCAPNFVNESIEACYSYEMNGSILTSDCIITSVTEDPQTGCETITNTNLNIYTGNDISVQSSDTSVYTTWNGQAFQWLDCSEAFDVIPGATDQSFEPIVNGIYSIELTNSNGCKDTSDCITFDKLNVSVSKLKKEKIKVFPNPFSDWLTLTNLPVTAAVISIYSVQGHLIYQYQKKNEISNFSIPSKNLSTGLYIIKVESYVGPNHYTIVARQ